MKAAHVNPQCLNSQSVTPLNHSLDSFASSFSNSVRVMRSCIIPFSNGVLGFVTPSPFMLQSNYKWCGNLESPCCGASMNGVWRHCVVD